MQTQNVQTPSKESEIDTTAVQQETEIRVRKRDKSIRLLSPREEAVVLSNSPLHVLNSFQHIQAEVMFQCSFLLTYRIIDDRPHKE